MTWVLLVIAWPFAALLLWQAFRHALLRIPSRTDAPTGRIGDIPVSNHLSDKWGIKPMSRGAVCITFYSPDMTPTVTATLDSDAAVQFAEELQRVVGIAQAAKTIGQPS